VREDEVVDPAVERIALALRRPVDLGPDVDRAVMAAIHAAPLMVAPSAAPSARPAVRSVARPGVWGWLVRPRAIRVSVTPIGALAAASIALVAALFGLRRGDAVDRTAEQRQTGEFPVPVTQEHAVVANVGAANVGAAKAGPDTVFVTRFVFVAPSAKQVSLVGDFNDWDHKAAPLVPVANGNGMWTVEVPLPPGVYEYAFLVDGKEWKTDPEAPRVGGDFGHPNSVVTVREARST
jgi:hypothetical protein